MTADKKIVHYRATQDDFIRADAHAYVNTVDHPECTNTRLVRTSIVVKIGPNGEFETENSRYIPVSNPQDAL